MRSHTANSIFYSGNKYHLLKVKTNLSDDESETIEDDTVDDEMHFLETKEDHFSLNQLPTDVLLKIMNHLMKLYEMELIQEITHSNTSAISVNSMTLSDSEKKRIINAASKFTYHSLLNLRGVDKFLNASILSSSIGELSQSIMHYQVETNLNGFCSCRNADLGWCCCFLFILAVIVGGITLGGSAVPENKSYESTLSVIAQTLFGFSILCLFSAIGVKVTTCIIDNAFKTRKTLLPRIYDELGRYSVFSRENEGTEEHVDFIRDNLEQTSLGAR